MVVLLKGSKALNVPKKVISKATITIFLLTAFHGVVLLLELKTNLYVLIAGVLLLLPIVHGAAAWKLIGGIILSAASFFVFFVGYSYVLSFHEFLISVIGYSIVGLSLGSVFRYVQGQKILLEQGEEKYRKLSELLKVYFDSVQIAVVVLDSEGRVNFINTKGCQLLGYPQQQILGKDWCENFVPKETAKELKDYLNRLTVNKQQFCDYHENPIMTKGGEERLILWHNTVLRDDANNSVSLLSSGQDITELKQTKWQLEEQLRIAKVLYLAAEELITEEFDTEKRAQRLSRICVEELGASLAWVGYAAADRSVRIVGHFPKDHPYLENMKVRWDDSPYANTAAGRSIKTRKSQVVEDIFSEFRDETLETWREKGAFFGFKRIGAFPLMTPEGVLGTLVLYSDEDDFFSSQKMDQFQTLAHVAAASLENVKLFEQLQRRFSRMEALHRIDRAISTSSDLNVTLSVVLDQVISELRADASEIFLFNPHTLKLELIASKGFHAPPAVGFTLKLGEALAGEVALRASILRKEELRTIQERLQNSPLGRLIVQEDFRYYIGVPLIAKEQLLGVLEIFNRSILQDDPEWFEYLQILSQQAAIAIENAKLFEKIRETNLELLQAYETTIEGWVYALDMRDKETEGHTERVSELTLRLAKEMRLQDEKIVHIKRGALLHDIGKMAIPDHILLKPGKLTDEEWEIMKKHPVYAHEMLSKIDYLRPALEIPYCHHERFNGTGYPRGLKGEEIPLSARIFAVVDVYDALTSDRPYRKAWSKEAAIEYIRKESGKQFDPKVVEVFLKVIEET
ncbi:HD domain-containing phosphohydrolase [Pseudothermotoga sp. U03pept]|uniref:HD domain-containing phosphohydrolase n=1 Tax=Pseudothermotoga sp. U03pept TaxID=3447012 RepID=UPI003F008AC7